MTRVVFGKTRTGSLVGWIPDPAGAPVDTRVLITKTRDGSLVGWPRSASGPAADTRVLIARADAGDLVAWALTRSMAGGGCPDLSSYNPVDRSWSFTGTSISGEGTIARYDSAGSSNAPILAGKGWCISDLYIRMTRVGGGSGEGFVNIIITTEESVFYMSGHGGTRSLEITGMFSVEGPGDGGSGDLDVYVETGNSGGSNFDVEVGWTATQFDWPDPY